MKTILFLSLVFGCNLIANAHQTVKSSDIDNLHFGDSIHYDLVDASKISAINLTGSLWDFSNIKYLGQEKEVCFIGDMEGHVKLIGQDEILDFKDGANADVEYFYDANGALVKDLNKGISNIEYDILGNLKCITFSNDFKTKYVYDAAGNKLRTTYESVVTNTTEGNCNTSITTLLKKAGVSDGEINRIKNQIPEFKTGFGDVKPWSDEERKEALRQKIKLEESLDNSLR